VNLGFLGAGNHARHHMREFSRLPQARLTSVYDVVLSRAETAARDFPPLRAAPSVETLLHHSDVEGVVIATPAETHSDLVEAALAAGKHVLLEKPMAHTPEEADRIAAAAEQRPDQQVLVGHCERFNRAYIDVRKAIDDGHIGTPRFASATRLSPLHLNDPAWSLGTLDTAVHDIDILLSLFASSPVAVSAQGTTVNADLPIPDNVIYQILFADGALAQGHIGWLPFSGGYPLSGNAHPRLFVAGTGGNVQLDLWQRPVAVHTYRSGAYFWPDDVLVGYGDYFTEVTAQDFAFVSMIESGGTPPITPREAAMAVRVAHAAHESLTHRGGAQVVLT
jgi:myo-inositol 2-dehydrogenase/D-chiro-inositol 1-dehydrogenase